MRHVIIERTHYVKHYVNKLKLFVNTQDQQHFLRPSQPLIKTLSSTKTLMNPLDRYFSTLQKSCLPGVWSKAIAIARDEIIILDSEKPDEMQLRIALQGKPVHPKVTLWIEDEDAYCDCGDRNDPCMHIAAAVIALKQGSVKRPSQTASRKITYRFRRTPEGVLAFERWIVGGNSAADSIRMTESLVSLIGGIQSGRTASNTASAAPVSATQEDYAIDAALTGTRADGAIEAAHWPRLLTLLKDFAELTLDEQPVRTSTRKTGLRAWVTEESGGYRLRGRKDPRMAAVYKNGIALCDDGLCALVDVTLTEKERATLLTAAGRFFSKNEAADLFSDWIPALQNKLPVDLEVKNTPQLVSMKPRLILETQHHAESGFSILPRIVYGDPAIAEVTSQGLRVLNTRAPIPVRDLEMESSLLRKARHELHLTAGQVHSFESDRLIQWTSELPAEWIKLYGSTLIQLLDAKTEKPLKKLQLAALCEQLGQTPPPDLERLRNQLENFQGIPDALLPSDLKADLRDYQRTGINWLCYLRELELGALLADDMGLGKTLQSLCAIQGRTLIVCPTSVIHSWKEQIRRFRPALKVCTFHGTSRSWDDSASILLTSYGLLRNELDRFSKIEWDTILIDEAQIIKNPQSQISQAVQALQGKFKITLSGTPVENHLDDLWSQMNFLNPGYLGTRSEFQQMQLPLIRQKVRPLILRRLKKDVAAELPPRTETVLFCTLSESERTLYDSVMLASRQEVLAELDTRKNVFGVLELLLRLRQACCHPSLIPGQAALLSPDARSSKIDLLMDSLQSALAQGHKALVFSQWTSFLDLIEKEFQANSIAYLRLDGSTVDRASIVEKFQTPDGPPVLLMSLKAGGVGLTLTAADHVYLMDPWWNRAAEDQAADRAHRIGQTNPVMIHKLAAQGTIEEKILALQEKKKNLARAVLENDAAVASTITREDLLALLS